MTDDSDDDNALVEWTDVEGRRWVLENGHAMILGKSPRECNAKRVATKLGMRWQWPPGKSAFKRMRPEPSETFRERGETAEERRKIAASTTTPWKGLPVHLRSRPVVAVPDGKAKCTFGEPSPGGQTLPMRTRTLKLRFAVPLRESWRVRTGRASPLRIVAQS